MPKVNLPKNLLKNEKLPRALKVMSVCSSGLSVCYVNVCSGSTASESNRTKGEKGFPFSLRLRED